MFLVLSQVYYWGFKSNTHNNYNYKIKTKWIGNYLQQKLWQKIRLLIDMLSKKAYWFNCLLSAKENAGKAKTAETDKALGKAKKKWTEASVISSIQLQWFPLFN